MVVSVVVAMLSFGEQTAQMPAAPLPIAQTGVPAAAAPPAIVIPGPIAPPPAPIPLVVPATLPDGTPLPPPASTGPLVAPISASAAIRSDQDSAQNGGQDIVVRARDRWDAPDPLTSVNVEAYKITEKFDGAVLAPVARTYKTKVPGTVRDGIHNFLYNLREPTVALNFLLQHRIGKAAETVARFALNSTVGALGLLDIARRKPFRLPRRSNGFSNTLGFYGVPSGLFLYLPIVGPTTVRDLFGGAVDRLVLPMTLGQGVTDLRFAIPVGVLSSLDHRSEFDDTYKALKDAPGDPYANQRDFYLQRRQAEIDGLKGRPGGTVGGMSAPPSGAVRLKQRGGAPTVVVPLPPLVPPLDTKAVPAPAPTPPTP